MNPAHSQNLFVLGLEQRRKKGPNPIIHLFKSEMQHGQQVGINTSLVHFIKDDVAVGAKPLVDAGNLGFRV